MSGQRLIEEAMSPLDAFELMCLELIQVEAVATAASAAMDECTPPPRQSRRAFDRAHALVSSTAEKAAGTVDRIEALKAQVSAHIAGTASEGRVRESQLRLDAPRAHGERRARSR